MDALPIQMLTVVAYHLPHLLACAVALALLWMWTQPSPGRPLALWGAGLLLGSALLQLALSLVQTLHIHRMAESGSGPGSLFAIISAANMLTGVIASVGLVLLAWGASKAMRTRVVP